MLHLAMKMGDTIKIGDSVVGLIEVGGVTKVGIVAPDEVEICRLDAEGRPACCRRRAVVDLGNGRWRLKCGHEVNESKLNNGWAFCSECLAVAPSDPRVEAFLPARQRHEDYKAQKARRSSKGNP